MPKKVEGRIFEDGKEVDGEVKYPAGTLVRVCQANPLPEEMFNKETGKPFTPDEVYEVRWPNLATSFIYHSELEEIS